PRRRDAPRRGGGRRHGRGDHRGRRRRHVHRRRPGAGRVGALRPRGRPVGGGGRRRRPRRAQRHAAGGGRAGPGHGGRRGVRGRPTPSPRGRVPAAGRGGPHAMSDVATTEPEPRRTPPAAVTRRAFRPGRTRPVRVELERQLRRRRAQVVFGLRVLLPVLLWVAFELAPDGPPTGSLTLVDLATTSGLNFAVFAMFASSSFLLVVVVALFFGDTVAAEASWSSLRYLLAAPVPRARLLRQKAVVAAVPSLAALLLLPVVALAVGTLAYGAGDMVSPTGVSLDYGPGTVRILSGAVYLAVHLSWVAALALLLSVSTDAPLGAVGGAVMVSI